VLGTLLTSTSRVAVWRLLARVVATAIWTLETLYDLFREEVQNTIAQLKPHSLLWYSNKAKAFQYGFNLPPDSDVYNNTNVDEQAVADSQIVRFAAVVEQDRGLRLKIAKEVAGDLAPLTPAEMEAFAEYMRRIKDAGVRLNITSTPADSLILSLTIFYNPLILNNQGQRLDGTNNTPVQQAIQDYLRNLPFNGVFLLQDLTDVLQRVEGVRTVYISNAQARYGSLPYQSFAIRYQPDSGYLRFVQPNHLTVLFLPTTD
jgi:hypothetical protein